MGRLAQMVAFLWYRSPTPLSPSVKPATCFFRRLPLPQYLAHIALLVRDYDEALAYFVDRLGFHLVQDTPVAPDKRWVLVAPPGAREATLLLARATTEEQRAAVGRQGGGRVFLFLHTDNFARDYDAFCTRGIAFLETPREEAYGTVAVFEDLYGNRWDLLQAGPPVDA